MSDTIHDEKETVHDISVILWPDRNDIKNETICCLGKEANMNIKMPGLVNQNAYGLKSVEDRLQRQQQRDDKIQFFENQKEKLKEMTSTDLSDIARKLELLHGYEDQIAAAKKEFNNSQIYKIMEEAEERGKKIKENAEKTEPKTPEERRKDAIKEAIEGATGVEQPDGMLSEIMEELEDMEETMEQAEESVEDLQESMDTMEELQEVEENTGKLLSPDGQPMVENQDEAAGKYRNIDYKV